MYSFKKYPLLLPDWHTKYTQGFQDISSAENSRLVVSSSPDVQQSALAYNFSFLIYNVIQCDTLTLHLSQTRKLNALVQSLCCIHTYIYNTCKQTLSVMELYKQTLKAVPTQQNVRLLLITWYVLTNTSNVSKNTTTWPHHFLHQLSLHLTNTCMLYKLVFWNIFTGTKYTPWTLTS